MDTGVRMKMPCGWWADWHPDGDRCRPFFLFPFILVADGWTGVCVCRGVCWYFRFRGRPVTSRSRDPLTGIFSEFSFFFKKKKNRQKFSFQFENSIWREIIHSASYSQGGGNCSSDLCVCRSADGWCSRQIVSPLRRREKWCTTISCRMERKAGLWLQHPRVPQLELSFCDRRLIDLFPILAQSGAEIEFPPFFSGETADYLTPYLCCNWYTNYRLTQLF